MTRLISLLLLLLAPFAVGIQDAPNKKVPKPFGGEIHYEQTFQSVDPQTPLADAYASKIRVVFDPAALRIDRDKGLQKGTVLLQLNAPHALRLDHSKKMSELGSGITVDSIDERIKEKMPTHFKMKLTEASDEPQLEICGLKTRKFRVQDSAFVSQSSTTFVWLTEDLTLPHRRYQFNFPSGLVAVPLLLSLPLTSGAILQTEVTDFGVTITTTAVRISEVGKADGEGPPFQLAKDVFDKPANYKGPTFPEPQELAPLKAASAVAIDLAKLAKKVTTGSGIELVLIAPTTFTMGSPANEPDRADDEQQHQVTLTRPFYAATTEVTQAQWLAVMGTKSPSNFTGNQLPVESITWDAAEAFCAKLSKAEGRTFRLPTEAEWELAATAGKPVDLSAMNFGARKEWLTARAWMNFNAENTTHEVAGLLPNALGLWDMLGNVEEWCQDGYAKFDDKPAMDPAGVVSDLKATRGNGWISSYDFCRHAARSSMPKDTSKSTIGFRVFADAVE